MPNEFRSIDDWNQDKRVRLLMHLEQSLEATAKTVDAPEVTTQSMAQVDDLAEARKGVVGLRTGFTMLDDPKHFGGLQRGSMYVLGGMTGAGKTLVCCNLVLNAVLHNVAKTLFITTEMPSWAVCQRLWQMWQSLPVTDKENFREMPIEWVDNHVTISTELIRSLLEKKRYDLLVVDNLQWFSRGGENTSESTGMATQAMKQIAVEFDLPVLLVSHLNRESYHSDDPNMGQLKGSSYIEQDADAVLLISRNTLNDEEDKFPPEIIRVHCQKNRLTGNLPNFCLKSDKNNYLEADDFARYLG